jgi:hypothetical protein
MLIPEFPKPQNKLTDYFDSKIDRNCRPKRIAVSI